MNDLKHGILDVNGFLLGPETSMEEVENALGIEAEKLRSGSWVLEYKKSFLNDGLQFQLDGIAYAGE